MMREWNEYFYELLEKVGVAQQAVKDFVEGNREELSVTYVEERLQAICATAEFIRKSVKEQMNLK
ncbi:MAG: hypothetical protein WA364_22335 [Candidatus Nitrosopolaris sp.]